MVIQLFRVTFIDFLVKKRLDKQTDYNTVARITTKTRERFFHIATTNIREPSGSATRTLLLPFV
jgi:hypothetical protein